MALAFTESPEQLLEELSSSRHGLSAAEAAERLERHGPNLLPEPPVDGLLAVFARQLVSPFIVLLLVAGALSLVVREWSDAAVIGAIVLIDAVVGTAQEWRAQRSAQALRQMVTAFATVVREGDVAELDATRIVPGDVVLLASGDKVPADARLLDGQDLEVDESLLTGESLPARKHADRVLGAEVGLGERVNMVFAGTLVVRGRADVLVVATGQGTELGTLAGELSGRDEVEVPLLVRMRRFTHLVAMVALAIAGLFVLVEVLRGTPFNEVMLTAVALAVSAIPEGLPVALTVALAIAIGRMSRRNVIVRRMAAVEALGSCTAIASDKTGTLTVNELTATTVVLPGGARFEVTGVGDVPVGEAFPLDPSDEARRGQLLELARAGALCNEAVLAREDDGWVHHGDALDVSLLVLAHKLGITQSEAHAAFPPVSLLPFESERRFAASRHEVVTDGPGPSTVLHVKGAVEAVLPMCGSQRGPGGDEPLDAGTGLALAEALAGEGYRVIAVASGPGGPLVGDGRLVESALHDLCLLGLVAMIDPPRTNALAAVEACRAAGLRVLMVTGDHPSTALAIARQVGIDAVAGHVVTGADLHRAAQSAEGGPEGAFDELVARSAVFARVEPSQKLAIVDSLVRSGQLVAVTGDGANDAPALRQAHVGVAMGAGGTDVAREAADLVVTDDDFSSIVAGIEEGRVAYANIRKVVSLLVSTGAGEVVLFLLALATGMALPLTAIQLLWLNLVTNGIQDVALAFEPAEGTEMGRPPRPPAEPIFDRLMLRRVGVTAVFIGVAAFAVFRIVREAGWSLADARNLVTALMVLFENVMVLNCRSETASFFSIGFRGNRLLILGNLLATGVHIAAMHLLPTEELLGLSPLPSAWDWAYLVAIAATLLGVIELDKLLIRRRHPDPPRRRPAPAPPQPPGSTFSPRRQRSSVSSTNRGGADDQGPRASAQQPGPGELPLGDPPGPVAGPRAH